LAENIAGSATLDLFVQVMIKPRIKPYEKVVRVQEGSKTRLECKFEGNPEPSVKYLKFIQIFISKKCFFRWMRNGRPLQDSSYILSPRGETLLIPRASREDAGDFSCFVENTAGSVEAPFIVVVQTAPNIDDPIDQNPQVIEGNTVVLHCPVVGMPIPTVTWKRNEEVLELTPGGKYQLDGNSNLKIVGATVSYLYYKLKRKC
jgi:hypothetical protein